MAMLNDSVPHVSIFCGQPDVINYTAADYWRELVHTTAMAIYLVQ